MEALLRLVSIFKALNFLILSQHCHVFMLAPCLQNEEEILTETIDITVLYGNLSSSEGITCDNNILEPTAMD